MSQLKTAADPKALDAVMQRIGDVSTLPAVALRVMEVAKDPNATVSDLASIIEGDAPISSKVLRTVNSAAYPVRERMTSIHRAISYLGFNQVRNLALGLSVSKVFTSDLKIGPYERAGLWRHLVAVALGAGLTARRCQLADHEDAFLAGLMHDLGLILEDQYVHKNFCTMTQHLSEGCDLLDLEREHLGFDHTMLGHRMAEHWKFPEVVQATIRYHHRSLEYSGPGDQVVRCVEISNFLCSLKGVPSVGINLVKPNVEVFRALNLGKEDIKVLAADLDDEIAMHEALFEMI